jgi:hypothetical protein
LARQQERLQPTVHWPGEGVRIMNRLARIDRALDEVLVNLGAMVLRLADPAVTRTEAERRALVRSVRQYSRCADQSGDPRVQRLRDELQETVRPKLRLVSSQ